MSLGSIVVNEVVYPIEELYLRDGEMKFVTTFPAGRSYEPGDGTYFVFGPDGELVLQGRMPEDLRDERKGPDDTWTVTVSFAVNDKLADSARRARAET